MDKHDIERWWSSKITKHYMSKLEEYLDTCISEMVSMNTETTELSNKYFLLQGKVAGIKHMLEMELDDEERDV